MKLRYILFALSTFFSAGLFAQPFYDNCATPYDVGTVPFCDTTIFFNNIDATTSVVDPDQFPTCFNGGVPNRDVWILFYASLDPDFVDYTITLTGVQNGSQPSITNPQVAVYRGECPDEMFELTCVSGELGSTSVEVNVYGLIPGFPYYLRINDYSATAQPNSGAFTLCIDSIKVDPVVGDGGSNANFGTICDDGGPEENYTDNANYTYQICPAAPYQCLIFEIDYYNIQFLTGTQEGLFVYAGDSTQMSPGNLLGQITGSGTNTTSWGGASQTFYTASPCITLNWISNGSVNYEGFCANWETSNQACPTFTTMTVTPGATDQQIVDALVSPQTELSVTNINCGTGATIGYGTFETAPGHPFGMDKGLVLSSGPVNLMQNYNVGFFASGNNGGGTDADLNALSVIEGNGSTAQNTCIVELDVLAYSDALSFEFIFGSEEYPEFVNTTFNDIFALLISGPGITGLPTVNNQENMALVPNTANFIQINSVNQGQNWPYYRSNVNNTEGSCLDGLTTDSLSIYKKSITAKRQVIPCNTYHLKFAIADRGDSAFDSAVFVSEISAGVPQISIQFSQGNDYLVEECVPGFENLVIELSQPTDVSLTFNVEIGGTASLGVDYTLNIPPSITFTPGMQTITYPISVLADNEPEIDESISISLTNDFGCGVITYSVLDVPILDAAAVAINLNADTVYACIGTGVQLFASGANPATYVWTASVPGTTFSPNPFAPDPTVVPTQDLFVYVNGTLGLCQAGDTAFIKLIAPSVQATTTDDGICQGESTQLNAVNNTGGQGVQWFPATVASPPSASTAASPITTTTYTVQVNLNGCSTSSSVTINVDDFFTPTLTTLDTGICQTYSIVLANGGGAPGQTFSWSPATGLNLTDIPNATATPLTNTSYTLTSTSANGYCAQTYGPVNVNVIPAVVDISDNYYELCIGEQVDMTVNTNTGGVGLSWSPQPEGGTLLNPQFNPTESQQYIATLNLGGCIVRDTVIIRVDSIPASAITLDPFKPVYCIGDIVLMQSSVYEPTNFPDMTFAWAPAIGAETPLDKWNYVVSAEQTAWYYRTITNRACSVTDSIRLLVVDPAAAITPTDTIVCPGSPVQIVLSSVGQIDNIQWSPTTGLSCTDCPDPIATVFGNTTFNVNAEIAGCPISASSTVNVEEVVNITIVANPDAQTTPVDQGTTVVMTATTQPDVTNSAAFEWFNAANETIGTAPTNTVVVNLASQSYTVEVTTSNGCTAAQTVVLLGLPPTWQIPNAFTPNGDGTNDNFGIIIGPGGNLSINRFQVFNRWGAVVFDGNTVTGWDGTFKGELQPSDLYNYIIELGLPNGSVELLTGELYLLR